MLGDESALVVLAPEAEGLAGPFRRQYDPTAALGVPAHLTVLYPFIVPAELDGAVIGALEELCSVFDGLRFALTDIGRLPGVVYLAPTPSDRLRAMTTLVWQRFPNWPPYGGQFDDVVPHLTCAVADDEPTLDDVAVALANAARGVLPIDVVIDELALLVKNDGQWGVAHRFALSGSVSGL